MIRALRRLLENPATRGLPLDDPRTTELRRKIIESKPFLRAIYDEWYGTIAAALPHVDGAVLELGSGAGYGERFIPGLITSEVFLTPSVQLVASGTKLPFRDGSLRAMVMTDVMHHIPDAAAFLGEGQRCLKSGGKILMIEPWVSGWSRWVYGTLHHEPFRPEAEGWGFSSAGPLSGANGALPWMVFSRDRVKFEKEFPELAIEAVRPFMPFRYMLSGGVGMRSLMPGFSNGAWRAMERMFGGRMAMFAFLSVRRR